MTRIAKWVSTSSLLVLIAVTPLLSDVQAQRGNLALKERWVSVLPIGISVVDILPHPTTDDVLYILMRRGQNNTCLSIFKTISGGISWEFIGSLISPRPTTSYGSPTCEGVKGTLHFDKRSSNIIYYAGEGIFKSMDEGRTWADIGAGVITPQHGIRNFAQDSIDPNILYLSTNPNRGSFKSLNSGKTWGKLSEDLLLIGGEYYPSLSNKKWPIRREINEFGKKRYVGCDDQYSHFSIFAVKPTPPNTLYGVCVATEGFYLKSKDSGQTWETIRLPNLPCYGYEEGRACKRPFIWTLVFVTGSEQQVIYAIVGSQSPEPLITYVYKTEDDGNTWQPIMQGLPAEIDDESHLVMTKSRTLYVNTYRGLYKSVDGGENWYFPPNLGLPPSNGFKLAIQKDNGVVFALSRSGELYESSDGGLYWTPYQLDLPKSLKGALSQDHKNSFFPLTLQALSDGQVETAELAPTKVKFWGLQMEKIYYDQGYYGPDIIGLSPVNPKIIYVSLGSELKRSEDGGFSWAKTNLPAVGKITAIVVDEKKPDNVIVVAGNSLYKTTDGNNWINITQSLHRIIDTTWSPMINALRETLARIQKRDFAGGFLNVNKNDLNDFYSRIKTVNLVALNASDNSILVAMALGGVYKSLDGGKTWKAIFKGRKGEIAKTAEIYKRRPSNVWVEMDIFAINHIIVHPKDPKIMYVATERGVFKSVDGGQSWIPLVNGLYSLNVKRLVTDQSFNLIFAETDDGIYRLSDLDMSWAKGKEKQP